MMRKVVLVAALLLVGCVRLAPLYNVRADDFIDRRSLPQRTVQIEQAATALGWSTRVERPGLIEATLHLRENTAVVSIGYTPESFSITYVSGSPSLRYANGEIHPNYNGWVQNLERRILAAQ